MFGKTVSFEKVHDLNNYLCERCSSSEAASGLKSTYHQQVAHQKKYLIAQSNY